MLAIKMVKVGGYKITDYKWDCFSGWFCCNWTIKFFDNSQEKIEKVFDKITSILYRINKIQFVIR